jgi:3-phosphoshikimate 1-carboxyvinyltransferase
MASSSSSAELAWPPHGAVARGRARLPPSKSLTHRAYAIALLSRQPTAVERPLEAEDTALFLAALEALGYAVERERERVTIAALVAQPQAAELDCGNAGTLFRFLVALTATLPGRWRIDGSPRLRQRPIAPLVEALRALGATIDFEERDGCAPLVVRGGTLAGGSVRLDASESSQYLSALLLAGQRAAAPIEIEVERLVSAPYVELTAELLAAHGGTVERPAEGRFVTRPSALAGGAIAIEPDLSAAAYPAAAAALTGGEIALVGVSMTSKQGDRRFLELLERMGATVEQVGPDVRVVAPVSGESSLRAVDADLVDIPDQVPTLAALAPFAAGTTRITNVAHLRHKESDRLTAMTTELRRAGAEVVESADALEIPGVWSAREPPGPSIPDWRVEIDPHGDHRIAMAMALVGLRRPNLSIRDPRVVAKSWPDFWRELELWTAPAAPAVGARSEPRA